MYIFVTWNLKKKKRTSRGQPRGQVVKFTCSAAGGPVFRCFKSWAWTRYHSSSHAEEASHMPQLEGPTTKEYTTMYWEDLGEKKQEKKNVFFNFHKFVNFPVYLSLLITSCIPLWSQKILCMISIWKRINTCLLVYLVICPGECPRSTWEQHLFYCRWVKCSVYIC